MAISPYYQRLIRKYVCVDEKRVKEKLRRGDKIVAESSLLYPPCCDCARIWSPTLMKKYLRQYDLGPGYTSSGGKAKRRYRISEANKALENMFASEPRDAAGYFLERGLAALQELMAIEEHRYG